MWHSYYKNFMEMSLLNGVPNVPTYPTCLCALCAHVPKYILQTGKFKISILMKSQEGLFTDVFRGAELKFGL